MTGHLLSAKKRNATLREYDYHINGLSLMCEHSITRLKIFTNLSLTRIFISLHGGEIPVCRAYES